MSAPPLSRCMYSPAVCTGVCLVLQQCCIVTRPTSRHGRNATWKDISLQPLSWMQRMLPNLLLRVHQGNQGNKKKDNDDSARRPQSVQPGCMTVIHCRCCPLDFFGVSWVSEPHTSHMCCDHTPTHSPKANTDEHHTHDHNTHTHTPGPLVFPPDIWCHGVGSTTGCRCCLQQAARISLLCLPL